MKKITIECTVSTNYVGSEVKDEVEIYVDDDATDEEIESEAEEAWMDFRTNNTDGGWKILFVENDAD